MLYVKCLQFICFALFSLCITERMFESKLKYGKRTGIGHVLAIFYTSEMLEILRYVETFDTSHNNWVKNTLLSLNARRLLFEHFSEG